MDPRFLGSSTNGVQLGNHSVSIFPLQNKPSFDFHPNNPLFNTITEEEEEEEEFHEDCDLCDAVLGYIRKMLMEEEDIEDKPCMLHESLDLQAKERSFSELLQNKNPLDIDRINENPDDNQIDGSSPESPLQVSNLYNEGIEEAMKFIPNVEKREEREYSRRRKIRYREEEVGVEEEEEEERKMKLAAVYPETTVRSLEFDLVLLCSLGEPKAAMYSFREDLQRETSKSRQLRENRGGKGRGKGQNGRREVVDLRTLLISCAQAIAAGDGRSSNELLKEIRLHSSPFGDGNQRLACCLADCLEARLAGTGSRIYRALVSKRTTAADYLKAYHLYLASCPFRRISNFAANKTIMIEAEKSTSIHIIDFGILYGFQWPTFLQRISQRSRGPPRLRITGIEFPQPGFRPSERVEETGRRLADYARSFGVPFEYTAVAKRWENITLEDLKLDGGDEFLVVNCLYRSKNLLDETVMVDSPRNMVLNLIRKINPHIFIHGIVNGAYSAPFFVTRFREALFHFSAVFDMLDANVPREHCQRILMERGILEREAMNVIACEGWERVERPETYRQWQVRDLRAGFVQIPFDRKIVKTAREKVKSNYHKDFLIDEDGRWVLQGWKGRIIYALSCWKPV